MLEDSNPGCVGQSFEQVTEISCQWLKVFQMMCRSHRKLHGTEEQQLLGKTGTQRSLYSCTETFSEHCTVWEHINIFTTETQTHTHTHTQMQMTVTYRSNSFCHKNTNEYKCNHLCYTDSRTHIHYKQTHRHSFCMMSLLKHTYEKWKHTHVCAIYNRGPGQVLYLKQTLEWREQADKSSTKHRL